MQVKLATNNFDNYHPLLQNATEARPILPYLLHAAESFLKS